MGTPTCSGSAGTPTANDKAGAMAQSHATINANHANHDATHHQNPGGEHSTGYTQSPTKG